MQKTMCMVGLWTCVFAQVFRIYGFFSIPFFLFSQIFHGKGEKKAMTLKVIFIMSICTCLNLVLLNLTLYHGCSSLKLVYISPNNTYGGNVVRPTNDHMGASHKKLCVFSWNFLISHKNFKFS